MSPVGAASSGVAAAGAAVQAAEGQQEAGVLMLKKALNIEKDMVATLLPPSGHLLDIQA